MTDHRELLELAEIYVLDVLDTADLERMDAHLAAGCEDCSAVIRAARDVADQLVHAVPAVDPSPELRARLVARAEADRRGPPAGAAVLPLARSLRLARYALAASVVVASALGVRVAVLSSTVAEEREARASIERALAEERSEKGNALVRLAEAQSSSARAQTELAALRKTIGYLAAERTRAVTLLGQGELPDASARAYLDPESRRLVLFVYDLPPVPTGKSYQLWVIADGQPVSAGVFELDAIRRAHYETVSRLPLDQAVTIAVTIEPAGGLPQPSGPIVLAGT